MEFAMAPKIVDKEQKKIEIISAAMKVFAQNGVAKSKMIDIAREAKIGKGTIYEYFRSKDEIFLEAFRLMMTNAEAKILPLLHSNIDPFIKLKNFFDIFIDIYLDEHLEFAGIMMEFWAEGIRQSNQDLLEKIDLNEIYKEYRAMIQEILNDGVQRGHFRKIDTFGVASSIVGVMDGLFLQWIMDRSVFDLKTTMYQVIDVLLNGIKK